MQDHVSKAGRSLGELVGAPFYRPASVAGPTYGTTGNMAVGATYVLSPSLILDGNFGYTAYDANSEELGLGKNIGLDTFGIPGTNGTRRFESGWPRFTVSSYATMGAQGGGTRPFYNRDPRTQYVGNATWTQGRALRPLRRRQLVPADQSHASGVRRRTARTVRRLLVHGRSDGAPGGPTANQFNNWAAFQLGLPTTIGKTLQVPEEYNVRRGCTASMSATSGR